MRRACMALLVVAATADRQSDALRAFFYETQGQYWRNASGWAVNADPCGREQGNAPWYGLRCDGGLVVRINLHNNALSGTIPAALANLTSLEFLDLSSNHLSGAIPSALAQMTTLQQLYLNNNNLGGSIPPALGNLTQVLYLNLAVNSLTGPIPAELANMSSLRYLVLANNALSGAIPSALAKVAPRLSIFFAADNNLSGTLPIEFCTSGISCGVHNNPLLKCPSQQCSSCNLATCNCNMYACLSPNDCAGGLCGSCGGSGVIKYCR